MLIQFSNFQIILTIYLFVLAFWFVIGSIGADRCKYAWDRQDASAGALLCFLWPVLAVIRLAMLLVEHIQHLWHRARDDRY